MIGVKVGTGVFIIIGKGVSVGVATAVFVIIIVDGGVAVGGVDFVAVGWKDTAVSITTLSSR